MFYPLSLDNREYTFVCQEIFSQDSKKNKTIEQKQGCSLIISSALTANNSAIDSIEKIGKLADFVVIPVDYMTIPAEDIWKIEPDMTIIGGEVVYTKPVQAKK